MAHPSESPAPCRWVTKAANGRRQDGQTRRGCLWGPRQWSRRARSQLKRDPASVDFRPKDGPPGGDSNGWNDFRGEKRSNETHASMTDPESRLARKGPGREAKLSYVSHVLMENRNGFLMDILLGQADGFTERREGAALVARIGGGRRKTVGGDNGYDATDFVQACRAAGVTPQVAPNIHRSRRKSAIDQRTLRHGGHRASQIVRRRIETIFGWLKSFGGIKRSRVRGLERTQLAARLAAAAYNLLRLSRLQPLEAGT
ncbi:MAG TPA: hypothetical protein DEG43_03705 [Acidimicrobiaceae bacterium]|nr:hypothetical protein [Acidimicrobiaceae bacterium]